MKEDLKVNAQDVNAETKQFVREMPAMAKTDLSKSGMFNQDQLSASASQLGPLGNVLVSNLKAQELVTPLDDDSTKVTSNKLKDALGGLFGLVNSQLNVDQFVHFLLNVFCVVVVDSDQLLIRSKVTGIYQDATTTIKRIIIHIMNYISPNFWAEIHERSVLAALKRMAPSYQLSDFNTRFFIVGRKALRLKDFKLVPFDENQLCTFRSEYTPKLMETPVFNRFIATTFDEPTIKKFIYEWLGANLDTSKPAGSVLFCISSGASGKSTLLSIMRELVGPVNVCGNTIQSLGETFGLQALSGCAALITDESSGDAVPASVLKGLCTGTQMGIKRKYQEDLQMVLPITMTFAFNIAPVAENTVGFERRLLFLKFPHVFRGKQANPNLNVELATELPGIMYNAIEALKGLKQADYHFSETENMVQDKAVYMNVAKSPVERFFKEFGIVKPGESVTKSQILETFKSWLIVEATPSKGYVSAQKFWPEARRVWPLLFDSATMTEPKGHGNRVVNDFQFDLGKLASFLSDDELQRLGLIVSKDVSRPVIKTNQLGKEGD
ncbi:DNA primase [Lactiplantibacillus plantarum]|nr:DNA primase [Lactiplantibacillus plantarum]